MAAQEPIARLVGFTGRGAGTDAERRAAGWLAAELTAGGRRQVQVETFWCRPNWALAHAWHVLLGLAGSLVSVASPHAGGIMILLALLCVIADAVFGVSPGRRLTFERASQNVWASSRAAPAAKSPRPTSDTHDPERLRLILTANLDAPRSGLLYRPALRRPAARLRALLRGFTPGWLGWLVIGLAWLEVVAVLRAGGATAASVGFVQLIPSVALVLALALLLELGTGEFAPGATDNASGVATVLALARALDVAPPRALRVDVLLQGAGDGGGVGLRRHLRAHRETLRPQNTVVLGFAPTGAGSVRWWTSDGALLPLRYGRRLRELARQASHELGDRPQPFAGRGITPTFPARLARMPSLTLGGLDRDGLVANSHRPTDTEAGVDPETQREALGFGLLLVELVDDFLARRSAGR